MQASGRFWVWNIWPQQNRDEDVGAHVHPCVLAHLLENRSLLWSGLTEPDLHVRCSSVDVRVATHSWRVAEA